MTDNYTVMRARKPFGIPIVVGGPPAVAIDVEDHAVVSSGTTVSTSLTVGSNANKIILAVVISVDSAAVTGITYTAGSGGGFTFIDKMNFGARTIEFWESIAPDDGAITCEATVDVTVTNELILQLYSLYNVDQTTPTDNYAELEGSNDIIQPVTITEGGLGVGVICTNDSIGAINAPAIEDGRHQDNQVWAWGHDDAVPTATIGWVSGTGRGRCGVHVRRV